VTQIRLHVTEGGTQYVTKQNGEKAELKVPSGSQSGIKVKGPFNISACDRTEVLLDFDGKKSIHVHPNGTGLWILRPVIFAKTVETVPGQCTDAGVPDAGEGNPNNPGGSNGDGGTPFLEGPGSPCEAGTECLSGNCNANACAPSAPGGSCRENGDCASNACGEEGTCAPGNESSAGAPCTANEQCLSGTCSEGSCAPGDQGAPCRGESDCSESFNCVNSACEAPLN
jgi:hypothetical protein